MDNSLSYIEDYFTGQLSVAEKEAFEDRCVSDPTFAEEVAFYVSVRDGLKQELYEQKKKEFSELYAELSHSKKPAKGVVVRTLVQLAAACVILVTGWILFFQTPSTEKMADQYIDNNLEKLELAMNGSLDSLQMGIAAYNAKNYHKAELIFTALAKQPAASAESIKNLGIVYLVTERYDQALLQFEALARQSQLYANPGLFYKALVLMKRSGGGDRREAKEILQEVIEKDLEGSKEAKKWILNYKE